MHEGWVRESIVRAVSEGWEEGRGGRGRARGSKLGDILVCQAKWMNWENGGGGGVGGRGYN